MGQPDFTSPVLALVGAVVIWFLVFLLAGCRNVTTSGNIIEIKVQVLPLAP